MNARRVQYQVGVFVRKRAGPIRSCWRKDDIVDRFRADEKGIRRCTRAERNILRHGCELERSNGAVVFESGMGSERAGLEKERSQMLERQSDRLAIVLTQLRVNMEMGAADQGPSAIGSPAAEWHKNSQHQDGKVLHDQTIPGFPHVNTRMAVIVDTGTIPSFLKPERIGYWSEKANFLNTHPSDIP